MTARLSIIDLWRQANGDRDRYRKLMIEHGHLVPGEPQPLPCGWPGPTDAEWVAMYDEYFPGEPGMTSAPSCCCAGCLGMGPCDDGTPCSHGCGATASTPWDTCQGCEDELTGRDEDPDDLPDVD